MIALEKNWSCIDDLNISLSLDRGYTDGGAPHRQLRTTNSPSPKNIFEELLLKGHDEDFTPRQDEGFIPTDAPAGSPEKIEVIRSRVERGYPLFHPRDRVDYAGLTGAIRPRD